MRNAVSLRLSVVVAAGVLSWQPVQARVAVLSDEGIVLRYVAAVPGPPEKTWDALVTPASWWDGAHTYSGDAANLNIDPRPGGCFCETLPAHGGGGGRNRGGVEHMQVIHADRGKLLRMSGALGPLQADAVQGTMTFSLGPDGGGTRIVAEYVLAGYARSGLGRIAPAVDAVLETQIGRLAAVLGGKIEQEAK